MTLVLSDADVRASFDWGSAIKSLHGAYATAGEERRYPNRTVAKGDVNWLRSLTGIPADNSPMGAKIIAGAWKERRVAYLISLFDQDTAELLALMDGNSITGYRTAATSALATDLLARPGAVKVGMIGSGFEAQKHVRALAAVRELASVRVFSPRAKSRARFAAELADVDATITPTESAEAVVAGADVVICAARSYDESPILSGSWLEAGQTVVSIGSTVPEQREVDAETMRRADVIIADVLAEVLHETGDSIDARAKGFDPEPKTASLADLTAGIHPGRTSPEEIVLYKSVGAGLQDLAVASMCLERATSLGLGAPLPVRIQPVTK